MGFFRKLFGKKSDAQTAYSDAIQNLKQSGMYDEISELAKLNRSEEQVEWERVKTNDFIITFPSNWHMENTDQGLEICPPGNPYIFDEFLGKKVANPGVNIFLGDIPDKKINLVDELIKYRQESYEGYELIKFYVNEVFETNPYVIYEFHYGNNRNRFIAVSSIIQKNDHFIYATASGSFQDFEKYRDILERIVSSIDARSNKKANESVEKKNFIGKTRKCINCGAVLPTGGLVCSACGSHRFIWE